MKKQTKSLLILALAVVLCVGAYVGVRVGKTAKEKKEKAEQEAATVYLGNLTDLKKVSYELDGDTYHFELVGEDQWIYTDDPELTVDGEMFVKLENRLVGLKAQYSVDISDALAAYGLDPGRKVTAEDSQGNTLSLILGKACPGDNVIYAMEEGGDKVHAVTVYVDNYSSESILELATAKEFPEFEPEDVTKVSFTGEKFGTMLLEKDGEEWYMTLEGGEKQKVNDFKMPLELTYYSSPDLFMDAVINDDLRYMAMDKCVAYQPTAEDLARTGLDTPKYTIGVSYLDENGTEQSFRLDIGKYYELLDEYGKDITPTMLQRYAMVEGGKFLCIMGEDDYERLELMWYEFNGHSVKEEPVGAAAEED